DRVGRIVGRETYDHSPLGGASDNAHDYVVELEAHLRLLGAHLLSKADIAESAVLVHRGAGRDGIGLPARILHRLDGVLPALTETDVEAVGDDAALGAHQTRQQDIADSVVDRILMRDPAFLDDDTF